jgi:predicted dehydrogenase
MATVFVVGAGRFGRNYLNVLAALQRQNKALEMRNAPNACESHPSRLPRIDTIVLSRTRSAEAEATAAQTALLPACPFERVVGVEVRDLDQLNAALDRYQPDLTCIVARDRQVGDDIHALYAEPALNVGKVLCEKPFQHARGDGAG